MVNATRSRNSIIVLGEAGTSKTEFVIALHDQMLGEYQSAITTYNGSIKKFFMAIAMQLGCPTENDKGKPMTVDALKEEILINSNENTLLIFPESKQLTTSIRYWLEDMISAGARIVCFVVVNPGKDIFRTMAGDRIRFAKRSSYQRSDGSRGAKQELQTSKSRLAELQP